jgi:rod shape-determining protein MreD
MSRPRNTWVLPLSLAAALLLGLVPLPEALQPLRPYWLALVLAYWLLEAPQRMGLGSAFVLGLLADLAFGSLLGEQALRLVVLAFIIERFRARLRFVTLSQLTLALGVLLFNDRIITAVIHLLMGAPQLAWAYWLAPLLGMLLWPPLHLLLDTARLRRRG